MRVPFYLGGLVGCAFAFQVDFFYSSILDKCSFGGTSIRADENTQHGGVCAYAPLTGTVYACPQPDATCWTWAQNCNNGAVGQTVCNRGTVFCCNAVAGESCTTTPGQINVCISNFTSPLSGIGSAEAKSRYSAALGLSTVTATSQSIDPIPFSTLSPSSTPSATKTTTSITNSQNSLSTSYSTSISMSTGLSSSTTSSTTPTQNSSASLSSTSNSLSSGAIAGIVVGILVILIAAAAIFLLRRNKNKKEVNTAYSPVQEGSSQPAYMENNEKANRFGNHYGDTPPSEVGESVSRVELSTERSQRFEMP